jgi:bifunctional DNA-binding transcriptional regulator/antitoxin component of YhaV-PrlF toxin-antitoxin module
VNILYHMGRDVKKREAGSTSFKKSATRQSAPERKVGRRDIKASGAAAPTAPMPRTRISSKHQITIGKQAFDEAGFKEGDVVAVRALGPGRVELTRLDELFAKHRGRINTGGAARKAIDDMRDEWQ